MGILHEDVVVIKEAKREGENTVVTVNCPDKTGLGRDLCGVILLFGLSIAKGDVSTDGKWCYLVFWVVGKPSTRWDLLKNLLLEVCPICSPADSEMYYYRPEFQQPEPSDVFLLKIWCFHDKKGLLHDVTKALCELELTIKRVKVSTAPDGKIHYVTKALCELELTIKRVKVSTAPDGRVLDLLFVIDKRELLHTKQRRQQTIDHLESALGGSIMSCEIELASPEATICAQGSSFLPIIEDLFCLELPVQHPNGYCGSSPVSVTVDNFLSPSHSLLQISCKDHKGLVYDIMRTLKDYNIQISYGRFFVNPKGNCELDLFIMQVDGKKIVGPEKQNALCSRLKMELLRPLRVEVLSKGPDTELLVANPVELSGRGRPLVFHDITLALKILDLSIFSLEIARHRIHDREWEVYRILLQERGDVSLPRNAIKERVTKVLMGWE